MKGRFLKYCVVGGATFLFDLVLLYVFTNILNINYLVSAFVAFLVAVSINYVLSRRKVFVGSKRGFVEGYINFVAIISLGVVIMLSLMYILVEYFSVPLFTARILVAGFVGMINFLMNDRLNFRV